MARKYELQQRADAMEETRLRITEAAMELHGSVGPARTTVTAVAERAGVQRHTVYRHFPTEAELFASCTAHFAALHPWPDTDAWSRIDDPRERLATALDELYRWYEETSEMWTRILRDRELVEAIEPNLQPFYDYVGHCVATLSAGWGLRGRRKRVLEASIRHALEFATWQSLVRRGDIARSEAVNLMTALATASAS
ncbi:MAG TPA: helix-turn-helix domain-containing protein [Thermoleophilaceae bacterium]|jgi:AcrR family transcriptional regulator|nr:helix-turn-helix domain-containing protein [Thermoleophilaceae bacterium]